MNHMRRPDRAGKGSGSSNGPKKNPAAHSPTAKAKTPQKAQAAKVKAAKKGK